MRALNLLEHAVGDQVVTFTQLKGQHGVGRLADRQVTQVEDAAPVDGDCERLRLQSGAAAVGARHSRM